jgi:hypothetical protein
MPSNRDYEVGYGQLRRSNSDKGPEYWGRVRMTREQLTALVAWANANGMTDGYGDQPPAWELELAAWVKDGPSGKFFSLSLSQPYKSTRIAAGQSAPSVAAAADPDLPF